MTTFYIGTYTTGASRGLYRAQLDLTNGSIGDLQLVAELDNPAFFALHPTQPLLYACSEIRRNGKREGARLVAYRIESTGSLRLISEQPTGGQGPCYVSIDARGSLALVAHYASGSVLSLPLNSDGTLAPVSRLIQHAGSGPRADRQDGPHAHCIVPSPENEFACAVDLGIDQVQTYRLDHAQRTLAPEPVAIYRSAPGSGPRHLVFHPSQPVAFLIHELGNTLSALRWDPATGNLTELDTVSTLPAGFSGESITAEVLVHPQGRWVIGSNRGHDSLVVYEFDQAASKLKLVQHIPTGGKTPRNFRIDPSGRYVLAANQDSDSIIVFQIDANTGLLTNTGQAITVGHPSCLKFVQ